jgi:hypothetical protein
MRRILSTIVASAALLAIAPAIALAQHGEHHRSHRSERHHARVRHEGFGRDAGQSASVGGQQDAGTVRSFDGHVLTITLNDGSTVSGSVTTATEVECEAPMAAEIQNDDRGQGGDGAGDNGDRGGGDQGQAGNRDQDAGQGPGDEQGEDNQTCTTVVPGMVVREAELTISATGAIWDKVELATQQ